MRIRQIQRRFISAQPDSHTLETRAGRGFSTRTPNRRTMHAGNRHPERPIRSPGPAPDRRIIRAEKIEKYYAQPSQNRIQVISATDLDIVPGEILALLGPSGSGKSTMLRMLSGLSTPTAGQVYWHEKPIAEAEINVSIVFQSFALFPWLTVLENVEAPLQARGVAPAERRERSMKMLDTVGLDGFEAAYPKELSGGMKQRVGFARALVVEPEVLFMDEPFTALDVLTAENLRSELLELWANKTMPTKAVFLVTHNIEEAVLLADRIIVLGRNPGHIRTDFRVQLAQPRDRKSEPFTQLVDYIYKVLTRPDMAPAEAPISSRTRVRDQRQMHYQMLPHARPGGMAGLLELLLDKGGRDDIYRLADDLSFEIDDLLPIVDAAQLLGFLKIEEGDAAITPSGTEFANSEILRQKELFRDAAVGQCAAAAPDSPRSRSQERPHRPGGLLPRHARRAVQRGGVPAPDGDRRRLGPLRRAVRLRRRPPPLRLARRAGRGDCRQRGGQVKNQHPLARTLVTARTWPFLIDWTVILCGLAFFLGMIQHGNLLDGPTHAGGRHLPLLPRFAALRLLFHRAHGHCLPAQPGLRRRLTATSPPTIHASRPGCSRSSTFSNRFPSSASCPASCWP